MKMTIGKKIALLIIFLYPFFVLTGIIGILGIEATGRSSYEIIDRANFLINLQNSQLTLLRAQQALQQKQPQTLSAYLTVLKKQTGQALNFLNEHRFHFANAFSKEKILKELLKEINYINITPDFSAKKLDALSLGLTTLIKDSQEGFKASSILPYKTQAVSVASLSFLTAGIIILGAIGATLITRSIRQPLKKITQIASTISHLKGDLRQELTVESSDEVADLVRAFNQMSKNLAGLMGQVRDMALQVVGSSNKIKQVSQTQTDIALHQSSQVEEANSFIARLKDAANQIAQNARTLFQSSQRSLELTKIGTTTAEQAIKGIGRIGKKVDSVIKQAKILEEKSKSIDKILSWIEEISKKIDLVTLNVNIEVKKTKAGGGFALLAQEIRRLSERSQEATEEIRGIIKEIHNEIDNTVALAAVGIKEIGKDLGLINLSGKSMQEINLIVEETNKKSKEISQNTQEQEELSAEAFKFISYIQNLSKESLAHSKEIQGISQQIDALSNQLKQAVGKFKID